jgi:superfamily II DNA/RNA helicase
MAATYVLVLTPTRELAVQVQSMIQKLAQFTDVHVVLVVGGLSLQAQAAALRAEPEIVVATPVRVVWLGEGGGSDGCISSLLHCITARLGAPHSPPVLKWR